MRSRHSKAYDALAICAGRQVSMNRPTAKRVAEDENARSLRDAIWLDYERKLRDDKTYRIDDVWAWLSDPDRGVTVGRSSVHRDRRALLQRERTVVLAAAKAAAVLDAAKASGQSDILKGGRHLAAQLIFNTLSELPESALEDMEPAQVLRLVDSLSKLSKASAETDLITAKLAELRKKFDEAITATQRKISKGDGKLSDKQIQKIREAIFGSAA